MSDDPRGEKTLGAYRKAKRLSTFPDVEIKYWLPCKTWDALSTGPHCYFITSNWEATILCPVCRSLKVHAEKGLETGEEAMCGVSSSQREVPVPILPDEVV